jgi:hypothetical protein
MTEDIKKEAPQWIYKATNLRCIKVEGGQLYQSFNGDWGISMCFVPDVDLQRYQAHLRDAYNQGFKDGQEEAKQQPKK